MRKLFLDLDGVAFPLALTGTVDPFNRNLGKNLGAFDLPNQFRLSAQYEVPRFHAGILGNKIVGYILSGYKTLLRWLEIPEFKKRYLKARRKAVEQATARLQQATGAARTVILKLMADPNVPAAVRLRAAESALNYAIKGVEQEDIEARVSELEEAAEVTKDRR